MGMGVPPSARRGGRREPMSEINVTPFVDVMLVLLIIFMVTAPLLVTGVPVKLPETRANALDQEQKPDVVSIDATGMVFVNEEEISGGDLPARLTQLRGSGAEPPQVYLRADTSLDYGEVMSVMGELNRAGLNRVALVSTSAADVSAGSGSAP